LDITLICGQLGGGRYEMGIDSEKLGETFECAVSDRSGSGSIHVRNELILHAAATE